MSNTTITKYTRTMRIIPWHAMDDNRKCYTLVMEWWCEGLCIRDERFQMESEEFEALKKSMTYS